MCWLSPNEYENEELCLPSFDGQMVKLKFKIEGL